MDNFHPYLAPLKSIPEYLIVYSEAILANGFPMCSSHSYTFT